MKYYATVTFGMPAYGIPRFTLIRELAIRRAQHAKGTGTCSAARVYETEDRSLAVTADISEIRDGETLIFEA